MAADALAIVGLIRNAQGIRGEVVIEPLTDAPDAVFAPGRRVFAGAGPSKSGDTERPLTVAGARPFKGGVMVKFEEVSDRTAAEMLRGRYVFSPFDELAPPDEGEVYLHDLIGMSVREPGVAAPDLDEKVYHALLANAAEKTATKAVEKTEAPKALPEDSENTANALRAMNRTRRRARGGNSGKVTTGPGGTPSVGAGGAPLTLIGS